MLDETLLLRGREGRRSGDSSEHLVVSSRFLTNSQSIRYEMEGDFIPYLEKQCVLITSGSGSRGISYDFQKAQMRLIERYFSNVPVIDLEIQTYQYAHEQVSSGGIDFLRQKVPQEEIPLDIIEGIKNDMPSPADAQMVMEIVETAIAFLSSTGGMMVKSLGSGVSDMLLADYVRTVLLIQDELPSRTISKNIALKHLASLLDALNDMTSCDIFGNVDIEYMGELSEDSQLQLVTASENLELGLLLPTLRSFITSRLTTQSMASDISLKECLGYCEVGDFYLEECEWFDDFFPEDVLMKETVKTYHLLEQLQNTK